MAEIKLDEYQLEAANTAVYPGFGELEGLMYVALGLAGEAGEVTNKIKKIWRDDNGEITHSARQAVIEEIGDLEWYIAMVCMEMGISLEDIFVSNLIKLKARQEANTLHGSGDNR